jgi:hypothetical protein
MVILIINVGDILTGKFERDTPVPTYLSGHHSVHGGSDQADSYLLGTSKRLTDLKLTAGVQHAWLERPI